MHFHPVPEGHYGSHALTLMLLAGKEASLIDLFYPAMWQVSPNGECTVPSIHSQRLLISQRSPIKTKLLETSKT